MKRRETRAAVWEPWRRLCPQLLAALRRSDPFGHTVRSSDAEDLLHDVVVGMVHRGIDPRRLSDPVGYVLRAVRHRAVSLWRRQVRSGEVALMADPPVSTPAAEDSLSLSFSVTCGEILPLLSQREQQVLAGWMAGKPIKQIARELSLDVRQVKRSLVKCAALLKIESRGKSCPPSASCIGVVVPNPSWRRRC